MNHLVRYVRRNHLGALALLVAMGGTSYAATALPRDSVGSAQIKTGAVGSSEVRDGSLTKGDFKKGQLPAGARGPAGAKGATGAIGATGATGATGAQGEAGPQGEVGATGPAGETGPQGVPGPVVSYTARLTRTSTAFSVPTSATGAPGTPLEFTTERYDVGDLYDPAAAAFEGVPGTGQLTVPVSGTYILTAGTRWAENATGVRSIAISGPNGAPPAPGILAQSVVPANPVGVTTQDIATSIRLTAGQKVYVSVGQSSGDALSIVGSLSTVHFTATYVGP